MTEPKKLLLTFAKNSQSAAELLCDAVCNGSHTCTAQISDLNRRMLSDLADAERHYAVEEETTALRQIHALAECVTRAFSAALLLPQELPKLPPLAEIVNCNAQLALFPEKLLTTLSDFDRFPFYSLHLCANKGRGAHALLLNNYVSTEGGKRLLPLSQALEAHRNALEHACGILMERNAR